MPKLFVLHNNKNKEYMFYFLWLRFINGVVVFGRTAQRQFFVIQELHPQQVSGQCVPTIHSSFKRIWIDDLIYFSDDILMALNQL